jgi:hypothetical protein
VKIRYQKKGKKEKVVYKFLIFDLEFIYGQIEREVTPERSGCFYMPL